MTRTHFLSLPLEIRDMVLDMIYTDRQAFDLKHEVEVAFAASNSLIKYSAAKTNYRSDGEVIHTEVAQRYFQHNTFIIAVDELEQDVHSGILFTVAYGLLIKDWIADFEITLPLSRFYQGEAQLCLAKFPVMARLNQLTVVLTEPSELDLPTTCVARFSRSQLRTIENFFEYADILSMKIGSSVRASLFLQVSHEGCLRPMLLDFRSVIDFWRARLRDLFRPHPMVGVEDVLKASRRASQDPLDELGAELNAVVLKYDSYDDSVTMVPLGEPERD